MRFFKCLIVLILLSCSVAYSQPKENAKPVCKSMAKLERYFLEEAAASGHPAAQIALKRILAYEKYYVNPLHYPYYGKAYKLSPLISKKDIPKINYKYKGRGKRRFA